MNSQQENTRLSRPSVVVIIPFYNGSAWIERAIKSVIGQTIQPDEFIIVNDGSKREERSALGHLAEKYPIRIIDKENGGQGSARNAGVAASTSEYICFLDQDDKYLPMHIEDLLATLPERDLRLGYVYADLCEGDEDGNIVHSNMLRQQAGMHPKEGNITHMLGHDLHVLPSASLILRSAFDAVGGFDEQFMGYEDDDLFLRLFRAGYTNYYLDKPVTVWCMHTGSTSWSVKMSRSRFKYFRKLADIYRDEPKRNRFYLRDCLIPRFGDAFINEAKKAVKQESPDASELMDILCAYHAVVEANENVKDEYKKHLARSINIIKGEPITKEIYGTFQDGLYQCYRSTSWRITRPLRLGRKDLVPDDEGDAYEKFMRVRNSLSWKVAAPVRIAKLALRRLS